MEADNAKGNNRSYSLNAWMLLKTETNLLHHILDYVCIHFSVTRLQEFEFTQKCFNIACWTPQLVRFHKHNQEIYANAMIDPNRNQ